MYGLQVFVCGSSLEPRRMRILAPRNSTNPFGGLENCSEDITILLRGKITRSTYTECMVTWRVEALYSDCQNMMGRTR